MPEFQTKVICDQKHFMEGYIHLGTERVARDYWEYWYRQYLRGHHQCAGLSLHLYQVDLAFLPSSLDIHVQPEEGGSLVSPAWTNDSRKIYAVILCKLFNTQRIILKE